MEVQLNFPHAEKLLLADVKGNMQDAIRVYKKILVFLYDETFNV